MSVTKIPASDLIALFRRMYKEHWRYTLGASAEGCVDCSGAFVYAYRQFHKTIAHGSNAIARTHVAELLPITEARPGMAAFKLREPGDPKYALPDKYRNGGGACNGDLNDYYHIGLVDDDPAYILNAQSTQTGFVRSKAKGWACVGYLKAVDYGNKEVIPMQTMIVTAANGDPVRVRKSPSTSADTIARLPVGTAVQAGDDVNGWREIVFDDAGGYMMSKFLQPGEIQGDTFIRTLTAEEYNRLCEAREQMEAALSIVKSIVGVG